MTGQAGTGGRSLRQLRIPLLGRVEGRGALDLDIEEGRIAALRLRLLDPPRLFERLLEGYGYDQAVDAVARICGLCPVAYQLTLAPRRSGELRHHHQTRDTLVDEGGDDLAALCSLSKPVLHTDSDDSAVQEDNLALGIAR